MKQTWPVLTIMLGLVCQPALAKLGKSNGFSGEVAISAAYSSKTSNLSNTDSEFETYRGKDQKDSSGLLLPLGNVQYTFGSRSQHEFFLGTSRSDVAIGTVALETGYRHLLSGGTKLSLSILPTILDGEVWRDPYLVNTPRKTTDESGLAYRLQMDKIAGSLFSLDLAYAQKDIDNEDSGTSTLSLEEAKTLNRNSDIFYSKAKMMLPLNRTLLLYPALIYSKHDAEGTAMSNDRFGAEVASFTSVGNHKLALTLSYLNIDYDGENPLFGDKKQQVDQWKIFLAYEYPGIFNIQNLSVVSFAGATSSNSNIDFYDEKSWIAALGVNWKF